VDRIKSEVVNSQHAFLASILGETRVDEEAMRRRLRIGYPVWLAVGEEISQERCVALLSEATNIPSMQERLKGENLHAEAARTYGAKILKARRWVPLKDGSVVVADPFGATPDGDLGQRPLRLAPASEIDEVLGTEFPSTADAPRLRHLGRLLLDEGLIDEETLAVALDEQERSGGKLGEILTAQGAVDALPLTRVLAKRMGLPTVERGEAPSDLLPANLARAWGAVALVPNGEFSEADASSALPVAFAEPEEDKIRAVSEHLRVAVQPKLVDRETLNDLMGAVYAEKDIEEAVGGLLNATPQFSAFGKRLSPLQATVGAIVLLLIVAGSLADFSYAAVTATALASLLYFSYTFYRIFTAWKGWRTEATLRPSAESLASLKVRELPVYTLLLPVYKEKPSTMRALFESLSRLDYPKHKLDGILLVEADDEQTLQAIGEAGKPGWLSAVTVPDDPDAAEPVVKVGRPGWLRILPVPRSDPRTKPKAMIYGLLYARGDIVTVYDAEDQPEPHQLKEAVWGFKLADDSVACLQAKLSYYNPRLNLLTR
jgi:hypothetical protein